MAGLALIISIIALIFAYLAFKKSGGTADELKSKVEGIGISTENLRKKTADTLSRLEKIIRRDDSEVEREKETADTADTLEADTVEEDDREEKKENEQQNKF
jgi:hypothetical protein